MWGAWHSDDGRGVGRAEKMLEHALLALDLVDLGASGRQGLLQLLGHAPQALYQVSLGQHAGIDQGTEHLDVLDRVQYLPESSVGQT